MYVAYPLRLRHLEEMMAERGVAVGHSTVHRWALKILPVLDAAFRQRKRVITRRWRMDETYVKINGQWKYLYRAVDQSGKTVDFLLTAKLDTAAAQRFLAKAMAQHGQPDSITIDKSGANRAAIQKYNAEQETAVVIRQNKSLNNLVEQDHRAVKRMIRPMLGFKSFRCARILLAGIELMHMIRKRQMRDTPSRNPSPATQFYALAA